jgi:deoxyribose-phosphate aldolase
MTPTTSHTTLSSTDQLLPDRRAALFDHTKLTFDRSESPEVLIPQLCKEAKQHGFAAVCVRPEHVRLARQAMGLDMSVALASVVGFPDAPLTRAQEQEYPLVGAVSSTTKFQEIAMALSEGADELDVVMNVAFLKIDHETGGAFTEQELAGIRGCADLAVIKLILETGLLSDDEIRFAVRLAAKVGIDCIKTSTGMVTDAPGATVEHVALIRQTLDEVGAQSVWIKASGGIKTWQQVEALVHAGAARIGSSRCVEILEQAGN